MYEFVREMDEDNDENVLDWDDDLELVDRSEYKGNKGSEGSKRDKEAKPSGRKGEKDEQS